jgi:hypothetical protein
MKLKKIYLWPAALAVIFMSSIIIILSPVSQKTLIPVPTPISVSIDSPLSSPFEVVGKVQSSWMFEGTFSVELLNSDYQNISSANCSETIPGSWTQEEMIEFTCNLNFRVNSSNGYLVFRADNPSGLPENDKTFTIPVSFSSNSDTMKVKIYQSPTDVSESCESVDFIEVDIPKSVTPLKDSLNYLISHLDNPNGFKLVSAVIKDGVATLIFDDPNFFTSGGSCWSGILSSQVEKTALQFSGVKSVKFAGPEWLFQP